MERNAFQGNMIITTEVFHGFTMNIHVQYTLANPVTVNPDIG
jgi:hypothetical protein